MDGRVWGELECALGRLKCSGRGCAGDNLPYCAVWAAPLRRTHPGGGRGGSGEIKHSSVDVIVGGEAAPNSLATTCVGDRLS